MNVFGLAVILTTRWLSNTTSSWFGIGCLLLVIAIGNVWVLIAAGINPSQTLAALVGLGIHGSLGTRFVGNWLTAGAK